MSKKMESLVFRTSADRGVLITPEGAKALAKIAVAVKAASDVASGMAGEAQAGSVYAKVEVVIPGVDRVQIRVWDEFERDDVIAPPFKGAYEILDDYAASATVSVNPPYSELGLWVTGEVIDLVMVLAHFFPAEVAWRGNDYGDYFAAVTVGKFKLERRITSWMMKGNPTLLEAAKRYARAMGVKSIITEVM